MPSYKVIHTNILVELIEKEEEGIVSAEESPIVKGVVKEIGKGVMEDGKLTPMEVRPQSLVWFNIDHAVKLPFDENLYVLPQEAILVIEED